jgi:hypothetical protein
LGRLRQRILHHHGGDDALTGSTVVDEFAARFVYFYSGYALAPYVFAFAATVIDHKRGAVLFLLAWALFEAVMVIFGYAALPVISLGVGFIGALAVVTVSALLSTRDWALPIRYAGENSIVVYLAFFLPMAATRTLLLKFAPNLDLGLIALIVTIVAAITPLLFFALVKNTRLSLLFKRPAWARAEPRRRPQPRLVSAE